VPVSARTGVGGFIFPGDRVDLMLTQAVEGPATVDGRDGGIKATETILTNLRVLATDQSTESTTTEDGKTVVTAVSTVTMEVTPRIAEMISVAQTIGTLSLSLRSIADNQGDLDRAVAAGEVDLPDDASAEEEEALLRRAIAGPRAGAPTVVTGGDISRYQRRTVAPPIPVQPQQTAPMFTGNPLPQGAPAAGTPAAPTGPTVRVTRRQSTEVTPVGRGAGALLDRQSRAVGDGAAAVSGAIGIR